MFNVRSARAFCPPHSLESGPTRAHVDSVAATQRPHTSLAACPPFDSAVRVCVPPAAQLRHVQRHGHGRHVRGALRACPGPHSLESGPPRACRLRRRHPTPSRLPGRTSSRVACPPFDSAGRVGVQPAAQLRHVQGHGHEPHVLRALRACPGPQPCVGPSPCMPLASPPPPTPSRLPGRTSSRFACPPFDSAARVRVQPVAELRHVHGHGHEPHVLCALRACPGPHSLESVHPRAC